MNKSTKTALKWTAGIIIMMLLCWQLYSQIRAQLHSGATFSWWPADTAAYFFFVLILLPVNLGIESRKWQWLITTAGKATFGQALKSVLTGIAASVVTPNRIGEYPARILSLKQHSSTRLISVSVLGACAQLLSLMIAGVAGLVYYCSLEPMPLHFLVLTITAIFTVVLALLYFSFERWAPKIERFRALRKLRMWARLLHRFSRMEQARILAISMARMLVFMLQFWLLLRWQGVDIDMLRGLLLCALFFWALAIIPSIALAELGIRGTVAVFLFSPFTGNVAGISLAVFMLWCINLIVPAFLGTILFLRKRSRSDGITSFERREERYLKK